MVDFSDAERNGYVSAFIEFRQSEGSTRTPDDLRSAAEVLLKGCEQHFSSGVTRIARIGGVIPPGEEQDFRSLSHTLVHAEDLSSFHAAGQEILRRFPLVTPWLSWWLREEHASMLFQSHRRMEPILWESMPSTTNAEEAMHWKIYKALGTDHHLMDGMRALLAFVRHYDQRMASCLGKKSYVLVLSLYTYLNLTNSREEDTLRKTRAMEAVEEAHWTHKTNPSSAP